MNLYYKVIKDGKVIDVLDELHYLKYNKKHNRMFNSTVEEAQAILSSDGKYAWHEISLHKIPVNGYDTVELEQIDEYEYKQLKMLNLSTPEAIIEAFLLSLIEEGVI